MNILVACEYSGRVRDSFIRGGHNAVSCDLLPADQLGAHYQGDVFDIIGGAYLCRCGEVFPAALGKHGCPSCCGDNVAVLLEWDLMIAHPPCTYLTCSAEWAYGDGPYHQKVREGTLVGADRRQAREEAIDFVLRLYNSSIPRVAIENPIGVLSSRFREPDQFIQPYEYGEDGSKKTCLWLRGLQRLQPTGLYPPRLAPMKNGRGYAFRWGNQTDSGQNRESPGEDRWKIRSTTWQGWADAMADQWGKAPEVVA